MQTKCVIAGPYLPWNFLQTVVCPETNLEHFLIQMAAPPWWLPWKCCSRSIYHYTSCTGTAISYPDFQKQNCLFISVHVDIHTSSISCTPLDDVEKTPFHHFRAATRKPPKISLSTATPHLKPKLSGRLHSFASSGILCIQALYSMSLWAQHSTLNLEEDQIPRLKSGTTILLVATN